MSKAWQRMKRIALALFRRKAKRQTSVVMNGETFISRPLTDEDRRRLLERLNRE